ncbi:hypothetical protein F5Y04DRAFT_275329 [Hypomontagnella monticulosa]|nr:hypothetical protein F5Y04DRAFT_275329 [Hypomontagnella monticulosa]
MSRLSNLKIVLLGLAAGLPLTVNAADCFSSQWSYYENVYNDSWNTRNSLCTNGNPDVVCNNDGTFCAVSSGKVVATWEGPNKNDMYGVCGDAMENTILRCVYSDKAGGVYNYSGHIWTVSVMPQ